MSGKKGVILRRALAAAGLVAACGAACRVLSGLCRGRKRRE